MSLTTTTHLNFRGEARAALEFYQSVFGGDLVAVTYRQLGAVRVEEEADQVVWGQVASPDGFRVMAFDVTSDRPFDRGQTSFYISVRGQSTEEVQRVWDGLSQGGEAVVPMGPSAFSPMYGMVTDRFGITWIVDIESDQH